MRGICGLYNVHVFGQLIQYVCLLDVDAYGVWNEEVVCAGARSDLRSGNLRVRREIKFTEFFFYRVLYSFVFVLNNYKTRFWC